MRSQSSVRARLSDGGAFHGEYAFHDLPKFSLIEQSSLLDTLLFDLPQHFAIPKSLCVWTSTGTFVYDFTKRKDGYDLRNADGTLELVIREALNPEFQPFLAEHYELTSHSALCGAAMSTATATARVGDAIRSETEDGDGAINALERALRQCLFALYPEISRIQVTDFRVQTLDASQGTTARVRVSLAWAESGRRWVTAGVAGELLEAARLAGGRLPPAADAPGRKRPPDAGGGFFVGSVGPRE